MTLKYPDIRVVAVDDEETCLRILQKNLVDSDFFNENNMQFFKDPFEAFKYLKENKADILITDYRMPGMNGDVLVMEIRKHHQPDIKTALFTASKLISFPESGYNVEEVVDLVAEKDPDREKILEVLDKLCGMIPVKN